MVRRLALVRRRAVWLPTLWGWLLLVFLGAAALVPVGRGLYPFLAVNEPVGAPILVIEGWMDPAGLDQALVAFRKGGYQRAVTTGARIDQWPGALEHATSAERAAEYLEAQGLREVSAVPSPASAQDRTFLSAVMVREWARRSGLQLRALDVFSQGAHARRSRLLYRLAFGPDVQIGVLAARQAPDLSQDWWRTATGAREILDQAIALAWTKLFFWPPRAGSHEERWAVPAGSQSPRE
jgi:hypothetical protein